MNTATHKSKVVVVGAGKVGADVAYAIMMNNLASGTVLVDIDRGCARGEARSRYAGTNHILRKGTSL